MVNDLIRLIEKCKGSIEKYQNMLHSLQLNVIALTVDPYKTELLQKIDTIIFIFQPA